ncbi:NAD(P)H-dependent flavin oxidoreductase (plasmid) [Pseudonocardia bannensis]|uniref:NAD(P)H-dependent flavin oxidoreductase n=1 Tax=Pseudonocardia TaxID=1847 RepID=UPI0027E3515F|nr:MULTISPECIES: nitronate monooxygenase [Pseudonocardia]
MGTPGPVLARLRIPVIAAPMFLVSGPELVLAAHRAGIVGAFPAPNARELADFDRWCQTISTGVAADAGGTVARGSGAWAVNLFAHRTYRRLDAEVDILCRYRPDLVITSLGAPNRVVDAVHGYGGEVFADVATLAQSKRALAAGVDGLVLVCAGSGGHTGTFSPLAFVSAVRGFYDGPLLVAGGIGDGRAVAAVEALGADGAYVGTRFIAATESLASEQYRDMLLTAEMADVVASRAVTGVTANWLRPSLERAGYDVDGAGPADFSGDLQGAKPWKQLWSAGHGVGSVRSVTTVRAIVDELVADRAASLRRLADRAAAGGNSYDSAVQIGSGPEKGES